MRMIDVKSSERPAGVNAGPAPMLQWVPIEALVVDDSYQRELKAGNWKAIRRIAANFKWSRFSPVFVAPVEGGRFAIIDGQHRTHAAAICGFSEVPCQVVQMNREEQAAAFAAVNGLVTKVTSWQIYKAAHAAGEKWALEIAAVAEAAGCKVMFTNASSFTKKPGEIFAIKQFRELVSTHGGEAVTTALRAMMAAEGYRDDAETWDSLILRATVGALCSRPPALASSRIVDVLEAFPLWETIDRINTVTRARVRTGQPYLPKREALQDAITDWLDKKLPARMALPQGVPAHA